MQFGMIYLKTWDGPQVYVAFPTLEFHSCFSVLGLIHRMLNSLMLHKAVSVVSCVKSLQLAHGWSLSSMSCCQNGKWGGVFMGVGWLCLS